jgi:hypothetical protein
MIAERDFLLLALMTAMAAMPASAQDAARTAGQGGHGTRAAAAIPDFSGIWSHPGFPGFEPPASGPGPVVNKMRRPQTADFDGRVLRAVIIDVGVIRKTGRVHDQRVAAFVVADGLLASLFFGHSLQSAKR